jgi:2-aminobenzoate-CoA ligase
MTGMSAAELSPSAHVDTFARDHLPPVDLWPDLVFDLPGLQYPARLNCVAELLDRHVAAGRGAKRPWWSSNQASLWTSEFRRKRA